MYKFSSRPRAISAATAMASWASSSSDDGGAASRGRGASMLAGFSRVAALHRGSCVSYDDDGADAGAAVRLLRWRQARGAAARVTAARWGRGFGEARRQASTRFGRGEATRGPGIHPSSIVIPNREPRTFNARARETPGRRDRLGRVRVDGVAPGDDFRFRAAAAGTKKHARYAIDAQAWRNVRSPTLQRRLSQQIVSPRPPFFSPPSTRPRRPSSWHQNYSFQLAP